MFTDLDFLDDNNDWGRMEHQLAALYPEPVRSPLDRPRPAPEMRMMFWLKSDKAFNQFCKEWKNG
jgi:hypothetical protein